MKGVREYLGESSLSRLLSHMSNHDTGTITAFRYATDCGEGDVYTKKQNLQRNKSLQKRTRYMNIGI